MANGWFQERRVKKEYDCIAQGVPKAPLFKITKAIPGESGSVATQVEIKESYREGFYGRVRPLSGKRHQIRIHLSGEGFPLWGDVTYGGSQEISFAGQIFLVNRVALHAARLELPSGDVFVAEWPEDFKGWIEKLRAEGSHV